VKEPLPVVLDSDTPNRFASCISSDGWVNDKMLFRALSVEECLDLSRSLVDAADRWPIGWGIG
jgi:hypothetical protein